VEPDVVIGDDCTLASRVVIKSGTTLGDNNTIHEGTVIGGLPQHTRMPEKLGRVLIGSHNTIRENCTVHRALHEGTVTTVGSNNLLMVGAHVGHDSLVGCNVILANNVLLGGFVNVADRAFVSGAVGVHQFCRIGRHAFVGPYSVVIQDVLPYSTTVGKREIGVFGANRIGLERRGFQTPAIEALQTSFRLLTRAKLNTTQAIERIRAEVPACAEVDELLEFIRTSERGVVK
jgi:UDP-N-acetylglucosamine acyltransferase